MRNDVMPTSIGASPCRAVNEAACRTIFAARMQRSSAICAELGASIACRPIQIVCLAEDSDMRRFVAGATLLVAGCVEVGEMIPLDETARAIGTPKIEIVLQRSAHGPVAVTMPDGE